MSQNIQLVQDIYRAFGAGDVDGITSRVHADAHWDFNVTTSDVPWHVPVTGPGEIANFIAAFTGGVTLEAFEPQRFMADGDDVLVHIRIAYTVNRSGAHVDQEQIHWWTARGDKISRLRHFEDTAQVIGAWNAAA